MNKGWAIKRFGDVCEFDKAQGVHRGLPYVGLEHIESHTARFIGSNEPLTVKSSTFKFTTEHVLYGRLRPYLNKVLAPDFKGHCSTEIFPIKPASQLSREYLLYWLLADETVERINATCTGARMPRADMKDVLEFDFPLPPLPEQQRIVGILDEAFDGIATAKANAEKNLQNARALFESHLQSVFTQRGEGWVEKPLSKVCDLQNGYAFKSADYVDSSNTLNIRMSAIRPDGYFDPEHNQRFLPDSYAEAYAPFLLNEGELIIAMTDMAGDPKILGVPTLVSNLNGRSFLMNQRVGKLFGFSDDVRVPYLRYFLSSSLVKQYYKSKGAGGLQINISKGDILSARIPVPSIAEQENIVDQLDTLAEETQRLESIYQQKLAALAALKKSLLHQAFSGAL